MFALFVTSKVCEFEILFLMGQKVSKLFFFKINYSSGYVFNLKYESYFDFSSHINSRARQIALNPHSAY